MFKLLEAELVAYRKSDEAEGYVADEPECCDGGGGREAQALYTEPAEAVWTDENAGDKICRDRGKLKGLCDAGHEQTGDKCDCYAEKCCH